MKLLFILPMIKKYYIILISRSNKKRQRGKKLYYIGVSVLTGRPIGSKERNENRGIVFFTDKEKAVLAKRGMSFDRWKVEIEDVIEGYVLLLEDGNYFNYTPDKRSNDINTAAIFYDETAAKLSLPIKKMIHVIKDGETITPL